MPDEARLAAAADQPLVFRPKPERPPPASSIGVLGWMRANLFSSVSNALLTLLGSYIVIVFFTAIINWALIDAVWDASNRRECLDRVGRAGACWPGVIASPCGMVWPAVTAKALSAGRTVTCSDQASTATPRWVGISENSG